MDGLVGCFVFFLLLVRCAGWCYIFPHLLVVIRWLASYEPSSLTSWCIICVFDYYYYFFFLFISSCLLRIFLLLLLFRLVGLLNIFRILLTREWQALKLKHTEQEEICFIRGVPILSHILTIYSLYSIYYTYIFIVFTNVDVIRNWKRINQFSLSLFFSFRFCVFYSSLFMVLYFHLRLFIIYKLQFTRCILIRVLFLFFIFF